LPLRGAPAAIDGLRIAQISDIHIGQNLDVAQLERFVERVNAERPDLICITGDIADSPSAELDAFLPTLARLRAPHGIYAILGNHDHYAGADRVAAALQQHTPFTLLRDRQVGVEIRGQRVHMIGLDDRGRDWARGVPAVACLATILESLPAAEPKVLLCHRPDIFPQAAAGRNDGAAVTEPRREEAWGRLVPNGKRQRHRLCSVTVTSVSKNNLHRSLIRSRFEPSPLAPQPPWQHHFNRQNPTTMLALKSQVSTSNPIVLLLRLPLIMAVTVT
jgi:hypothetical protein